MHELTVKMYPPLGVNCERMLIIKQAVNKMPVRIIERPMNNYEQPNDAQGSRKFKWRIKGIVLLLLDMDLLIFDIIWIALCKQNFNGINDYGFMF